MDEMQRFCNVMFALIQIYKYICPVISLLTKKIKRMRKFTLLFMSMFLVLGTAMAKDEVKDFNSPEINPANGELATTVYNIRMKFPKHIEVANTEVSIDVLNTKTDEVVKITSCTVDQWDPYWAVFAFEKIEVDGKDGKEYRDQYIEKAGTYTYTIPAGIIKSVDGDEFAGGTYTFSIVATFEVVDWSPKEATEVSEIVVTFDQEITETKLPDRGLEILDDFYYTPVAKVTEAVIGEDKKSVILKFDTPINSAGGYLLNLSQGAIISGEEINAYKSLWFTIVDPAPSFSTNYNNGDRVKELGNLEITFKNVTTFEMVEDQNIIVVLPGSDEIAGQVKKESNKFVVSFDADLTEVGTYIFIIPAGCFTMDGEENEGRIIEVELYDFEIVPLKIESVTPEVGTVDQIDRIAIKFNQPVRLYFDKEGRTPSSEIVLKCGGNEYVLLNDNSNDLTTLVYTTDEWTGTEWASKPITAEGVYTLDLSSIIVNYGVEDIIDEWGYPDKKWHVQNYSLEGTYTWTVSGNNASVDNIPVAEGEQVIYDLLGRRVENITGAGIYIVNGRKVIVK